MPEFAINFRSGCVHIRGQCSDASARENVLGTEKERCWWYDIDLHNTLADAARSDQAQAQHPGPWRCMKCCKAEGGPGKTRCAERCAGPADRQ